MKYIILSVSLLLLFGCQSTKRPEPPNEKVKLSSPIKVTVKISNEVSFNDFQTMVKAQINKRNYNNQDGSLWCPFIQDTITFCDYQLPSTKQNVEKARYKYRAYYDYSFSKNNQYYVFNMQTKSSKPITRYIYDGTSPQPVMDPKYVGEFTKGVSDVFSSLFGMKMNVVKHKQYSGTVTLKNNDVTAFANIQRLHKESFVSTNAKTDSEKRGEFRTKYKNVPIEFTIYPYKNVSKMQYKFSLPYERTYRSHSDAEATRNNYKDTIDESVAKNVINSAKLSLND